MMDARNTAAQGPLAITIARDAADREAVERELAQRGVALPTAQRTRWSQLQNQSDGLVLVVRDGNGNPLRALGAGIARSRALPGHRIYRIERLGAGPSPDLDKRLIEALIQVAGRDRRCLRVIVEVFERDPAGRERLGALMREHALSRVATPRMYERTVVLELNGSEEDIFAAVDKTARRHVRAPAKRGLELRAITDVAYAPRIHELLEETFRRTHGSMLRMPWDRIIEWSIDEPSVSRVVGLFDPQTAGLESLVSMAWGCAHGSCVTYEAGAGIRRADLGSTPLNYAPLWDLIAWSRRQTSASWFDLGGASSGDATDPLAGNLDFKRYFSEQIVDVGQEWYLEPHAARAAVARVIAGAARWMARVRARP